MKALPFSFASSVEACFIVLGRSYLTEAPFLPNSDASVIRLASTYGTSEDDAVYQTLA